MGDMGKMDDSIRKLVSPTNILGSAFGALGNIFESVGSFVVNTLAHAIGELLADAIQWAAQQIQELITGAIEAGVEFQKLSLRLDTLNFNSLKDSGMDYDTAIKESIRSTKEQLSWIQKLANSTPYDNTDIANTYTLARSYSFTDQEARKLTETTADFAAGMGLSSVEIVRIMKNFGQMRQLGKLTQRDLNDLAVGAFVPINDILKRMQVETGLTGDAFDDFRKTGDGVESFMRNFIALTEDNFGGSAAKMARTFEAATDNAKDFVKSILGLNVVKPILDVLGGHIADVMDIMNEEIEIGGIGFGRKTEEVTTRFQQIVDIATRIGSSLSGIIQDILGLAPDARGIADKLVSGLEGIAIWLQQNSEDIVWYVNRAVIWLQDNLLPAIQQVWSFLFGSSGETGAIQKFGDWLKNDFLPFIQTQVIPGVSDLFDAITGKQKEAPTTMSGDKQGGEQEDTTALQNVVAGVASLATALPSVLELLGAIGDVILVAFGGDQTQTFAEFVTNILIPAIQELTTFINENQAGFVGLFKAIMLLEVIGFIAGLVAGLILQVAALFIAFGLLPFIIAIVASIVSWILIFKLTWELVAQSVIIWIGYIIETFKDFLANVTTTFNEVVDAIKNKDWVGAGKALVDGVIRGVKDTWGNFITLVTSLAQNALDTFNSIFSINSPSKAMADIGQNIVKGLAKGVTDSTGMAVKAMAGTANAVMAAASPQMSYSPAITSPSQNTYSNTNNFALNVNSSAQKEPLLQDFSMLQSLVGG